MIRIFEHTDSDGDDLTIEVYDSETGGAWVTTQRDSSRPATVHLPSTAVTALRAVLRDYDPDAAGELARAYQDGRREAIDDHELITREDHEAAVAAATEASALDPARVESLTLAAAVGKELRSSGPLVGAGAVGHEPVLAYALFLLGQINAPAVSE